MQKNLSKTLHNFLIISLGNLIYTVAVAFFILPNNLITGGTTGLALFGQYMFHIPITAFVYVFNIAMFLLGAWVLGKAFALTTILSTFEYPFFLSILQLLSSRVGPLTDDMMLATLFAGAGIGIGKIGGSAMEAMARQPEASGDLRMNMIIAAALVEGVALIAIVVCLLTLFL